MSRNSAALGAMAFADSRSLSGEPSPPRADDGKVPPLARVRDAALVSNRLRSTPAITGRQRNRATMPNSAKLTLVTVAGEGLRFDASTGGGHRAVIESGAGSIAPSPVEMLLDRKSVV